MLVKEEMTKRTNFPMGRIVSTHVNDLGEVTGVSLLKGSSGEIVKRHVSSLIPLLTEASVRYLSMPDNSRSGNVKESSEKGSNARNKRSAALKADEINRALLRDY